MAKRRGRPSQALRQQILEQDAGKIAEHFLSYPLREPVDPRFEPYYRRILNRDLFAVWDYYSTGMLEGSFYELIGRLVPLQCFAVAKRIISDVQLCRDEFDTARGGTATPPDWVVYKHCYRLLLPLCQVARQFIRDKYKVDTSAKREQLWNEYCDHFFPTTSSLRSGLKTPGELKAWGETMYPKWRQTPHRCDDALWAVVERFLGHNLVPKPIFFELALSDRRADVKAERDKRYRHRRFVRASSFIARKYACAMVGISPSSVSHK
jgi:hypothetical protein